MDKERYLAVRRSDAVAFAEAARLGLDVSIASCPGWSARDLLVHLGNVYVWWGTIVGERLRDEEKDIAPFVERLKAERADAQEWQETSSVDELVLWFEHISNELDRALIEAAPDEPLWTWWPPNQTAGFVHRRMAHETAIHRWDMQAAHDIAEPIASDVAVDGVDEMLDIMIPGWREDSTVPAHGETYHFHRTDGPGEWFLRFDTDAVAVEREHAKADVAVQGSASDLDLFLWGRLPADRLTVYGDATRLPLLFQLAPPG